MTARFTIRFTTRFTARFDPAARAATRGEAWQLWQAAMPPSRTARALARQAGAPAGGHIIATVTAASVQPSLPEWLSLSSVRLAGRAGLTAAYPPGGGRRRSLVPGRRRRLVPLVPVHRRAGQTPAGAAGPIIRVSQRQTPAGGIRRPPASYARWAPQFAAERCQAVPASRCGGSRRRPRQPLAPGPST